MIGLTRSTLRAELAGAGLPLDSLEPVRPGGAVWRGVGPSGAWSVRWAPRRDAAALAATAEWLERLALAGVAAPRPWRARAAASHLWPVGEGVVLVTEWRRGTTVLELGWDPIRAEALGALLARTHAVDAGPPPAGARRYDGAWAAGAWERLAIERAVPGASSGERHTVRVGLSAAATVVDDAWRGGPGGPIVMAHADAHAGNVLEVGRAGDRVELAWIDVDRAGLAPVGLDLAFALLEHEDATAWAVVRGYRRWAPWGEGLAATRAAFATLALADNLAFLAGFEHERPFLERAWPALVGACAALAAGRPPIGHAPAGGALNR